MTDVIVNRCLVPESAYCFDGEDDYIEVADAPDLDIASEISIAVWVNSAELESHGQLPALGLEHGPR